MTANQPEGTIPVRERETIDDAWRDFANRVLKPSGYVEGSVPFIEVRRAFYAGAQGLWACLFGGLDPEHEPTKFDEEHMALVLGQLENFTKELEAGRA